MRWSCVEPGVELYDSFWSLPTKDIPCCHDFMILWLPKANTGMGREEACIPHGHRMMCQISSQCHGNSLHPQRIWKGFSTHPAAITQFVLGDSLWIEAFIPTIIPEQQKSKALNWKNFFFAFFKLLLLFLTSFNLLQTPIPSFPHLPACPM